MYQQWPKPRDALEGKGPQRRPQKRLDRRLEGVAKAVGGGYCRLQMPLKLALGVGETAAGRRLGALEGGGVLPPPLPMHTCPSPVAPKPCASHTLVIDVVAVIIVVVVDKGPTKMFIW